MEKAIGVQLAENFIGSLEFGAAEKHENLTVLPVFSKLASLDGYLTLDEAIAAKKFIITEMGVGGHVPELKVKNNLDKLVVVLDGEELIGAKQNRIVNTTIVINKKSEVVIPVSCVEQGRWSYHTREFSSGSASLYATLRSKKARAVNNNLKFSMSYNAEQGEVWDDISAKAGRLKVKSKTGAMQDIFLSRSEDIAAYEKAFKADENQIGFIALIDDKVMGFDVFGFKSIFPKVYSKLLRGYILDAVDRRLAAGEKRVSTEKNIDPEAAVLEFLAKVRNAQKVSYRSLGEGEDVRFEGKNLSGFAVTREETVVHAAAFAG